jgi:hypothetical protein
VHKRPQEFDTLVRKLTEIPINALDLRNVEAITFKLLRFNLGQRWKQVAIDQKRQYIQESAKLLWDKYSQKCSTKNSPDEAAIEAIDEVMDALPEFLKK